MNATLRIHAPDEFPILTMIEGITRLNERYLRDFPDTPGIYESGVVYEREGSPELWLDVANIIEQGHDDCEGLAGWRAAELRVAGFDADPVLKRFERPDGSILYHCITEIHMPDGRVVLDDPSARLGMFDRSGGVVTGLPENELAVRYWKPLPGRTSSVPRADEQRPEGGIEIVRLATFQPDDAGAFRQRKEPKRPEVRLAVANLPFDGRRVLGDDATLPTDTHVAVTAPRPGARGVLRSASTGAVLSPRLRRLPSTR